MTVEISELQTESGEQLQTMLLLVIATTTEMVYLVDVFLFLPQGLHLLLQGLQLGGGPLVVLSERDRLLQLVLQPVRVYHITTGEI